MEGSYLTVNDLYKAYTDWLQTHKAGMPINRETMAKYLLKFKKMRTLHSKSLKEFYSFYTDIGIKNSQVPMQKAVLGEIYRFYKLHAVHDFNCMDKIPLDAIYAFYLNWCKSEGNTPIHFHGFSKNTRMLLGNKHLIYKGTNSKGNMRRCLYGYKFFKPLAK